MDADIAEWIDLAREVGDLFGANMADDPLFREGVERNVARGTAFCVRIDGELVGAMSFHQDRITWLAVARAYRLRGVGRALVAHAMRSAADEVRVTTFGDDHPHPDSRGARALYRSLGFEPSEEEPGAASDGSPRAVLVWKAGESGGVGHGLTGRGT